MAPERSYKNNDCLGRAYSLGSFPDTHDRCGRIDFAARSAAVVCDGSAIVGESKSIGSPTKSHAIKLTIAGSGYLDAKPVGQSDENLDVQ